MKFKVTANLSKTLIMIRLGAYKGLRHGVCGCGSLLSSVKRYCVSCKRRKCSSFN